MLTYKYRVGQRCELLPPAAPPYRGYVGRHVTITGLASRRTPSKRGIAYYLTDALPRVKVPEQCLRPLDDKWSPPLGSWQEITKLLGTDIRKVTVPACGVVTDRITVTHFNCRCAPLNYGKGPAP
jgi:hypothetical protein